MDAEPGDITVFYRVTDTSDAALIDEVERICQEREHGLFVLTGSRPNGPGFMPAQQEGERQQPEYQRLLTIAPYLLESDVYVCGPGPWSESVPAALGKLHVAEDHIHLEEFSW
jgi:ferredoxin-NADP reductase